MKSCRLCLPLVFALCGAGALNAQGIPATIGVPFTYDILQGTPVVTVLESFTVTYSFQGDTGTFPPGLTLSGTGVFSGVPTKAGNYTASTTFTISVSPNVPGYPINIPAPIPITVSGGTGSGVSLAPAALSFSLTTGAAASQQAINLSSRASTAATFQASASGGSGLSVTGGGTLPPFGQASVGVTVNPASLAPGTYTGAVTISGSFPGSPLKVPVVVTVTGSQPLLGLSQSGLFFRTSAGGPAPPAQSFTVGNIGVGSVNWSAAATTFSGGSWLSISPSSGQSSSSTAPPVTVQVNPVGLAAGTYYGQIQVAAAGVPNSPQLVSVVLNVAASALNVDPDVRPTGLIFVGKQGSPNPPAQKVLITNLGSSSVKFNGSISYASGTGWLSVTPFSGTLVAGTPATPAVSAAVGNLAPGVYVGQIAFAFTEPKTIHNVAVVFIVLPNTGGVAAREAAGCTPTKLVPVFSTLGQSFTNSAAWPSSVEVTVADDCGTPMTTGSVVVSFSTGDEPFSLTSLNDGRWSGTWTPHNIPTATVSISAAAQTTAPALSGTASIGGTAKTNPSVPLVKSGGIVNAASNAASTPVAPGSYISIYGSALAQGLTIAAAPFPTTLGGTQVLLAGQPLPLYFTSDGQINALVPYGLATNTSFQVVVARGGAYSSPEKVTFADGGPAVFLNGQGAGIAVGVKADGSSYLVDAEHPTTAGDALVIYCAGLGAVNQSVAAGSVSPGSPLASTTNPVTATIDGIPANVFFAGLAPGFAGLYQVNVLVPAGLTPSASAKLVITIAGQSSPETPIAVK